MTLHPQLLAVVSELDQALARLHAMARALPESAWDRRADPARWSVGECVAHLNLASEAFIPIIRAVLASAPTMPAGRIPRYHRDPVGWLMWRTMGPPVRIRLKTTASFVSQGGAPRSAQIATFDRWQEELIACVHQAEGHDLNRLRIRSPFDPRVSYNLYAALTILPRHQHRHLWQAEQVGSALAREAH